MLIVCNPFDRFAPICNSKIHTLYFLKLESESNMTVKEWKCLFNRLRTGEVTPEAAAGENPESAAAFPYAGAELRRLESAITVERNFFLFFLTGTILFFVVFFNRSGIGLKLIFYLSQIVWGMQLFGCVLLLRFRQFTPGRRIPPLADTILFALLAPVWGLWYLPAFNRITDEKSSPALRRVLFCLCWGVAVALLIIGLFQIPDEKPYTSWERLPVYIVLILCWLGLFTLLPHLILRQCARRAEALESYAPCPPPDAALTATIRSRKRKSFWGKCFFWFLFLIPVIIPGITWEIAMKYADGKREAMFRELNRRGITTSFADFTRSHVPSPEEIRKEFAEIAKPMEQLEERFQKEDPEDAELREILSSNRSLLEQADRFLAANPRLRFPRYDLLKDNAYDYYIPEVYQAKQWLLLNCRRIALLLRENRAGEAAELFDRTESLNNYLQDDILLVSLMVSINKKNNLLNQFAFFASGGAIESVESETIRRWAGSMQEREDAVRSRMPLIIDSEILSFLAMTNDTDALMRSADASPLPILRVYDPVLFLDAVYGVNQLLQLRELSTRDCLPEIAEQMEAYDKNIKKSSYLLHIASKMTIGALNSVPLKVSRHYSQLRICRAGLSVELYRRKHGELPRSLDDLVPEFLEETPKSPFTGDVLRYEPSENGSYRIDDPGSDFAWER